LNDAVISGHANGAFTGIAAAVVLDGRIVYHRGFGTVSPKTVQPVLPSTRFRIGSVTKALTAIALLQLVDAHRLDLTAPIRVVLPAFALPGEPGWSELLTLHRLLSNQSGIVDLFAADGPRDDGALAAAFQDPQYLATIPLLVAPGTFYNYSN